MAEEVKNEEVVLDPPAVALPAIPKEANSSKFVAFKQASRLPPLTQLEQDVPWKLIFVVYALFAIGALILFGLFLMIMIRMYRQHVFQ
jgi:hypothetical protein